LLVDVPCQAFEERIADDLRVKFRILAPTVLAWIFNKKLTLGDARGAEGVRLDDVRACLQEAAMDVSYDFWLRQGE
jgi:hypothetical protein